MIISLLPYEVWTDFWLDIIYYFHAGQGQETITAPFALKHYNKGLESDFDIISYSLLIQWKMTGIAHRL